MTYKSDVKIVSIALLTHWATPVSNGNGPDYTYCSMCHAETYGYLDENTHLDNSPIVHELDCPVLVARDLTTRT